MDLTRSECPEVAIRLRSWSLLVSTPLIPLEQEDTVSFKKSRSRQRPYICFKCEECFRTISALEEHLKIKCGSPGTSKENHFYALDWFDRREL